ncbi:MAG: hypothetical protein QY312_01165 [Candidatus Dojkabacteria bacterium]|nr:MAG: hypothetical protein QY312_01165 [Candidatus Dojkabacteria bacterium]
MNNTTAKKLVVALFVYITFTGVTLVLADGNGSPNPYHIPVDTGINFDASILAGAGLYGVGVLMTSGAKALKAKLQ